MTKNKNNNSLSFLKYSALGFQMAIIILAGTFGGVKLDGFLNLKFPAFTVLFSVFSVIFAIYLGIKDNFKRK